MKYLFAGGGTGGHIFPAIAIADEIKKLDEKAEILFIGAKGRIEEKIVPSNNYKLETIDITGFDRSNLTKNVRLPVKFILALRRCRILIKNFKPDVVIGTGGFVCGPVVYTANRLSIPTLIQEGNSFAGRTIKFLAAKSDKVVINFEETKNYLKRKDNVIKISHPVRSSLKKFDRTKALEFFKLPEDRKTIFIFGGSQGARGINTVIEHIIKRLYENNLNIIWQTGRSDYEKMYIEFAYLQDRIKIFEFIENIDYAYSASDIVICRAGITSIMEIAYLKLASILIPLPTSAENHQEMNARSLEREEAAIVVLQNNIGEKLLDEIMNLIDNEERLSRLKSNVNKFSDPEAAIKIAVEAIKLTKVK
ncbi:MAG: undecaprenyldiphospho-muramoylpentapeptide beta-N-acetylglucosaminyltransferase [Bacteroidota bacterium]|nr:undecaprenyldiphospho-muramoylpentapeptide beta-N-acetylglucosaminyltransferase [Bacteroidota bacterium]